MLHGMLGLHTEACTEAITRTILYEQCRLPDATRGFATDAHQRSGVSATRRFLVDSRTQFNSQAARVEKVPIY